MLLDRTRLALNPKCGTKVARVGDEPHQEVLVIDDFYVDPEYVRALALSLDYFEGEKLPTRARISLDMGPVLATMRRLVHPELKAIEAFKGACFTIMDERAPGRQRHYPHPHVDDVGEGVACLAGLVYLNLPDQCRGGTAFYRHRETGVCENRGEISEGLAAYMLAHGLSSVAEAYLRMSHVSEEDHARNDRATEEWGYVTDSNDQWELLKLIEMRFNRCVVYDAHLFHSPYLKSGQFGHSMETRRLTQTMAFELPADTSPTK